MCVELVLCEWGFVGFSGMELRCGAPENKWLDLLGRKRLPVGPVGSSLQLPGASALWLLGGSPGTLSCSSLGGCSSPSDGYPGVPVLWGPLDDYGSDLLRI
ncbi:hypothetical protein ILYODFUR_022302 [Ilyodon furcidens]|uniref:Uncharacterized protein n=1 Tax=Ilyodon furcidens TaxID=33524 RepID=A0ABV0SNC6_9TELE